MTKVETEGRDWRETLFLPQTDFPMRAGLPKREPEWLERWQKLDIYGQQRAAAKGREKYILHDGPPYANGHLHIGHALNKILKDVISRSQQMLGKDSNYVPGWDCHGLPIEWKVEEKYRAKGKDKDAVPVNEFRKECREFAAHWIDVQREEFKRLGVEGDWKNPYLTMNFDSEARIANELMKFAMNGTLYRGSKPVMWSVVERTALAEAEVEYLDYESDTVWVKFPVRIQAAGTNPMDAVLPDGTAVVIWTTTPWTIPGNRAISFSPRITYGLYEVTATENDFGPKVGEKFVVADRLAPACAVKAKLTLARRDNVSSQVLSGVHCDHPLKEIGGGYTFVVPLLAGDHVTDEDGTGFVHTAPGHGREDFDIWTEKSAELRALNIKTEIPYTVGEDGGFTSDAPGFEGKQIITDKGKKGDANKAVIDALIEHNMLFARGRLKHQYPHSWRSKKPVIFRNTPQWFIAMDEALPFSPSLRGEGARRADEGQRHGTGQAVDHPAAEHSQSSKSGAAPHPDPLPAHGERGRTIRDIALGAIEETRFVPASGQNRLRATIESKPDWVLSRQRAWGVPITVFVKKNSNEYVPNAEWAHSDELIRRVFEAFQESGSDAWFAEGSKERFLGGLVDDLDEWDQVRDILDVWFDSGSTHAFCLEQRDDLMTPASLYLEGSDQHRGWFHSSLVESCGTRGRAPYDAVVTHGFTVTEEGRKMSKSLGNDIPPQDVIKQYGADILRLWVSSIDYTEDQRFGPEIIKTNVDAYRKIRNTFRFLLGNLAHHEPDLAVEISDMPELERIMLHRLWELDQVVREGYDAFDFKRIFRALFTFATVDLSAFYFDIRKDALYCDPRGSATRNASLTVLDEIFSCLTAWLAPMLCFTMEEVWLARFPSDDDSVHLRMFPDIPTSWADDVLAAKWQKVRKVRRVITGALEVERREKRIGSSLEAAPVVYIADDDLRAALEGIDMAEIAITSGLTIVAETPPAGAFQLDDVAGVGVVPEKAPGTRCARSWKVTDDVGSDADYPDLSARDAAAVREFDAMRQAAE